METSTETPVPAQPPAQPETPVTPVAVETGDIKNVAATSSPGESNDKSKSDSDRPKKGWPKGKKRKKSLRDETAPRQPLTGYIRFLNDRREHIRAEHPDMAFAKITKVLAAEWSALPAEQKQQYLTAAEQDRERYSQELAAYKQSEAYRIFSEQQAGKKPKEEPEESLQGPENNDLSGYDIPIFTEEFLDHNKGREAELRQLRKSNTDYEQQNATIQTYLAGLHTAIDKLYVETQQQRSNNNALQQHLNNLRGAFTSIFATIHVPGLETPTPETIDVFMTKLVTFIKDNPQSPIVASIKKAVGELDLQA